MSSPLVPHGPLLVRFTNDNINTFQKKKKKKFNSHLKRIVEEGNGGRPGEFDWGPTSNKTAEVSVMRFGKCVQCLGARIYLTCQRDCLPNGRRARSWAELSRHSLPTTCAVFTLRRKGDMWVLTVPQTKRVRVIRKGEPNSSCNLALNIQPQRNKELLSLPVNCLMHERSPWWLLGPLLNTQHLNWALQQVNTQPSLQTSAHLPVK